MRTFWSRVIINERSKLVIFWYSNVFCEHRKMGGNYIKQSERQWIIWEIANTVSRKECSDWWEEIISEVSALFKQSKFFWHLFFHVEMFNLFLSIFFHIYVYSVLLSLVSICIVFCEVHPLFHILSLKWGGGDP